MIHKFKQTSPTERPLSEATKEERPAGGSQSSPELRKMSRELNSFIQKAVCHPPKASFLITLDGNTSDTSSRKTTCKLLQFPCAKPLCPFADCCQVPEAAEVEIDDGRSPAVGLKG